MKNQNQIEKILKSKFGNNVKFVEVKYLISNSSQSINDSGYAESEVEEGKDGNLYVGNTEVTKFYVFKINGKKYGYESEDDAQWAEIEN